MADASSRVMASAVTMRRTSWLQNAGITPEVQLTIEDLSFDSQSLFSEKTDETLHSLKDSRYVVFVGGFYPSGKDHHFPEQQQ